MKVSEKRFYLQNVFESVRTKRFSLTVGESDGAGELDETDVVPQEGGAVVLVEDGGLGVDGDLNLRTCLKIL